METDLTPAVLAELKSLLAAATPGATPELSRDNSRLITWAIANGNT